MILSYDAFEKNFSGNSICLIYGNEQYLIDTLIKKIKKSFDELILGINFVQIDESNINELIPSIECPAFGCDKKLIIVKYPELFKKASSKKQSNLFFEKLLDFFENNKGILDDSILIVFVQNEAEKNSLYNFIEKNGIICEVNELKPNQLISKLKNVCALYKVSADENILSYLIETSGTNLQVLMNEIRKLIEHAGENGKITKQDVDDLAVKQIESVIFELTDFLANKKISKAMEVLDNLIYQKEPLQKILITLYNHFKKLYLCKVALNSNMDIITSLGLKPNQSFLVSKYKSQSSYFNENVLIKILREFADLDCNSKNGKIDIDVGLRSILCYYCS